MTHSPIDVVAQTLDTAKDFIAIFGSLPEGEEALQKAALRKQFHYLAKIVHPDNSANRDKAVSARLFNRLNVLRQSAEKAITAGRYKKPFSEGSATRMAVPNPDTFEVTSPTATYHIEATIWRQGDFSFLYRGQEAGGREIIAKIASEPAQNQWLEHEASRLIRFRDAASGSNLGRIACFVPKLLDTFLMAGEKNTRYRVNIMLQVPDLVSVADIIQAYPHGLEPAQAAWVSRRIIAQTLAASVLGVVHGAMVPDHIMVDPWKHEPLHIGWVHALEEPWKKGNRITHVIDRFRDFYPPEVFEKKTPDHRTDLYMAGKTMLQLLGGDVRNNTFPRSLPGRIGDILLRMVAEDPRRRPSDGREVLEDFTQAVRQEWGREYRPLIMPV